jgi:hypothetical protein
LGNPKDVGNHKNALFFAANLSFVVISVKYHLAPGLFISPIDFTKNIKENNKK